MHKIKVLLFLVLVGFGLAGSLSACVIEDDGHGGWHDHHDWR